MHPDDVSSDVEQVFHDEVPVGRFISRFDDTSKLRACYEAGPTGYELSRLLKSMGVATDVVAPSLIPRAPGDKVKTDNRDARRLARLHRAGELTVIRVPTLGKEAIRDLCRTRGDMVTDLTRTKRRPSSFLLRHNMIWRGGKSSWTYIHHEWVRSIKFDDAALQLTFDHYMGALTTREESLKAVEADLSKYKTTGPFVGAVRRLAAYRGIDYTGALSLAAEVGDWRRFSSSTQFMGFCALVPSEYSSDGRTRRGGMTKTGNAHLRFQLVESAWAYHHNPNIGKDLQKRLDGVSPQIQARSWKAQLRLCKCYRSLAERKATKSVVAGAVARELAGFLWAEMNDL